MKSKARLGLVVIFLIMVNFTIMLAEAASSQTVHIAETNDDGFITEAGIGIDSSLVTMLDPNMDIRGYLVFEDIEINTWEYLTNATLRLTSSQTLDFDNDSSVTIYGMKQSNLGNILTNTTTLSPSEVLSMPLTTALVNVNTSQFQGGAVLDINVTNILREIIADPHWDGHGRSGAENGDDLGFIILGAPDEGRFFYDYLGDPARSADLILHWGSLPPGGPPGADFNETYRDLLIWEIDHLGANRTGADTDLNWNLLNVTELTENDVGGYLTPNNDTWVTVAGLQSQFTATLFNDTGAANIQSFFVRFAVNVSDVTSTIAGSDSVGSICGISTATPTGGGGLADGGVGGSAGDWAGVIIMSNEADTHFLIRLQERSGAGRVFGGSTSFIDENAHDIIYGEFTLVDVGAQNWISYRLYTDPAFTNLLDFEIHVLTVASEPFRYPQVTSGMGALGGTSSLGAMEFYSYLDMPLMDNSTWIVTDPNGTQIGNGTSYDDVIIIADDYLGPDPRDPDPPSQGWDETGPFQRFNVRFYILALGMGLFWGPLMVFAYKRPTGYEFVIGAFIMMVGVSFMIAAGSV